MASGAGAAPTHRLLSMPANAKAGGQACQIGKSGCTWSERCLPERPTAGRRLTVEEVEGAVPVAAGALRGAALHQLGIGELGGVMALRLDPLCEVGSARSDGGTREEGRVSVHDSIHTQNVSVRPARLVIWVSKRADTGA